MLIAVAIAAGQVPPSPPSQQAPRFAPVAERPYRLSTVQRRLVAGVPRRFTAERRVVFRHEAGGWAVDMLLIDVSTDVPGATATRFVATAGALRGIPVRLHLASDGTLTGLDDETTIRAAVDASLAKVGTAGVAPPPLDRATLAEPMMTMIAPREAYRAIARRAVVLPSMLPGAPPLAGDETVAAVPGGKLRIAVAAHGPLGTGSVEIERERLIDAASGLVERIAEHRVTKVGEQQLTVDSETTLTPSVS